MVADAYREDQADQQVDVPEHLDQHDVFEMAGEDEAE